MSGTWDGKKGNAGGYPHGGGANDSCLIALLRISIVGLTALAVIFGSTSTAGAGDEPSQSIAIYHNDKDYTKAEVDRITKAKQADAKATGKTAAAVAMAGCYDWWQLASAVIPGGSIYEVNIGVVRLYWNNCYAQNKARTEHINSYVGWATLTSVMLCATDGAGNCTSQRKADGPSWYFYYAEAILYDMGGKCVKVIGTMVANKSNGWLRAVQLGPGWCG